MLTANESDPHQHDYDDQWNGRIEMTANDRRDTHSRDWLHNRRSVLHELLLDAAANPLRMIFWLLVTLASVAIANGWV